MSRCYGACGITSINKFKIGARQTLREIFGGVRFYLINVPLIGVVWEFLKGGRGLVVEGFWRRGRELTSMTSNGF